VPTVLPLAALREPERGGAPHRFVQTARRCCRRHPQKGLLECGEATALRASPEVCLHIVRRTVLGLKQDTLCVFAVHDLPLRIKRVLGHIVG
jgi:hypothetical protein